MRELYGRLRADGFDPWLDEEKILPGRTWRSEVTAAVHNSDVVLVCLSRHSINQRGFIQKEIRHALDAAAEQPEGSIFIIPVRLEECEVPEGLSDLQWVNLFESRGYEKLRAALQLKSGTAAAKERTDKPWATTGESRRPAAAVMRDLLKGLLVIALLLAAKLALGRTAYGELLGSKLDDLLHRPLLSADMPVVVVDTRDLRPAEFNVEGRVGKATPREPLRKMIEAVVQARPKAVGVLIDFSPDENGYSDPRDPEFFRFCLDLQSRTGVRVFLGVVGTATLPPSEWLRGSEYQSLAANATTPNDRSRMLSEIRVEDPWEPSRQPLKTMSAALADAYSRGAGDSLERVQSLREAVPEALRRAGLVGGNISEKRLPPGLVVKEFLIDFSRLDDFEVVRSIEPSVLRHEGRKFEGKVVLLGSGSLDDERNLVEVPGRDQKYSRVFLHAAAAHTLIRPRHVLTSRGRLVVDILFALTLLSIVVLPRYYYRRRGAGAASTRRPLALFTLLAVVAAVVIGVVFVRATRLTWDDFLSAPAVLIFHSSIEPRLSNFWRGLKERVFRPHL